MMAGCGDGKRRNPADVAVAADAQDEGDAAADADQVIDSSSNLVDADSTGDDGSSNVPAGCAEDQLEACEYASRGLSFETATRLTTTEPVTGRTLPLFVRVPDGAGPVPVVIWSHGGAFTTGGQNESVAWGELFAEHGYVAIHIGHAPVDAAAARAMCDAAAVPPADCVADPNAADEDATGLLAIGRSLDVAAVLEDLPRLSRVSVNNDGPALDLERVAVAGWSGGARGPMVAMGAKVLPLPGLGVFTNPHPLPKAALLMSPAGPGFGGFYSNDTDNTWIAMRGPTFIATGANDVKPNKPDLTGQVRRMVFDAQPGDGERWLLYSNLEVGVGGHGTYNFGDRDSSDARLSRYSRALASAARAFLDATLRDDETARAWLESEAARVLAGDVDWQQR
jgi:hypothetical protein